MRKEKLMELKKNELKNSVWYVKNVIAEEDLSCFSISQIQKLNEILSRAEFFREECETFSTLSESKIIHKRTGRIIEVTDEDVRLVPEEEILSSASSEIYKKLKKKKIG
jgi:hypothetical protein